MEKTMNTTMDLQTTIMSMLNNHMDVLKSELFDAEHELGQADRRKREFASDENYATYWQKQNKCEICEAKIALMRRMIDRISGVFAVQAPPMLTTV